MRLWLINSTSSIIGTPNLTSPPADQGTGFHRILQRAHHLLDNPVVWLAIWPWARRSIGCAEFIALSV